MSVPPSRLIAAVDLLRPTVLALALFSLGLAVAVLLDYDPRGRLVPVGLQAALAVGLAVVGLLWTRGARSRVWAADLTAAAASAFPAVVLAVALHGSTYAVGGLGIAQANRTPAVARYMETWHLVDYSYPGLPAFYPPLMPWVAGRVGALLDLTPALALKLASIVMLFAAPLLAYLLWRRLLPAPVAAFVPVAIVALIGITPSAIQQPDSLLALSVIIPWWLDAIYGLRRPTVRRWPIWVHGLIGALVLCLYYYYFFPLALSLLLLPVVHRLHGERAPGRYLKPFLVLAVAAVLSSIYWLPFVLSWMLAEEPISLQNLWFTGEHTTLPVDIFDATPVGVVMLAGLIHAVATARRDRLSAGLLLLLIAGYGWYVVAFALAVLHKPVLAFRTEPFVELLLLLAGLRALAALVGWAIKRLSGEAFRLRDVSTVATALGVALAFVLGQSLVTETLSYKYVQQSHDTPLPNGELQRYASKDAQAPEVSDRTLEAVVRDIDDSNGSQPVVLSTTSGILKTTGMYSFNQWHAIYAHPAGEFRARTRFLKQLASEAAPAQFAALARGNRFDPIDVVVLDGRGDTLNYGATDVDFPNSDERISIKFNRAQFSTEHWEIRQVGPYFVAATR